jgi:anti-anti-sigma regulatory factor
VGKGSFMNSPRMKTFGEERIGAGERTIVVDLGDCTGMDSTFMGTLAGMAARLSAGGVGGLQIADAGERSRRSLEDLGLDFLMEINPPQAAWRGRVETIRAELKEPRGITLPAKVQRAEHVLEAHRTLSSANEENARKFSGVVTLLESELEEKRKQS